MNSYKVGDIVKLKQPDISAQYGLGIILAILSEQEAKQFMRNFMQESEHIISYNPVYMYDILFQNKSEEYCLHEELELIESI